MLQAPKIPFSSQWVWLSRKTFQKCFLDQLFYIFWSTFSFSFSIFLFIRILQIDKTVFWPFRCNFVNLENTALSWWKGGTAHSGGFVFFNQICSWIQTREKKVYFYLNMSFTVTFIDVMFPNFFYWCQTAIKTYFSLFLRKCITINSWFWLCILQWTAFEISWMTWREETKTPTFLMRRTFTWEDRSVNYSKGLDLGGTEFNTNILILILFGSFSKQIISIWLH